MPTSCGTINWATSLLKIRLSKYRSFGTMHVKRLEAENNRPQSLVKKSRE